MAPERPDEIDRRIRESFAVEPAAVGRVVAGAKAAEDAQPARRWASAVAAGAALVLVLAAGLAWWPAPPASPAEAGPDVTGVLAGDILVLSYPDGSAAIVGADWDHERPPDGMGIVIIERDDQ